MDNMEDNEVRFTMRMEKGLYEQLKESAAKNRRSIAKELEYLTDFHLNQGEPIELPDNIAGEFMNKLVELLRQSEGFRKLEKKAEALQKSKNSDKQFSMYQ